MAVEATHSNFFPTQVITNRDLMNPNEANAYMYNTEMISGAPFNTSMVETLLPFHHPNTSVKADSGLTYNLPSAPRKRSRDSMNHFNTLTPPQKNNLPQLSTFLGEEISLHMQQQQMEIDHIIAHHTKKIRLEVEERQKQQARMLVSAIGGGVVKTLNEKDEQIQRMAKLNLFLQEKVKTLCGENQLWRDIAQTNEATAISLRTNLEQVLAHVSVERISALTGAGVAEEVESCCGSSAGGAEEDEVAGGRTLATVEKRTLAVGKNMCRKCEERESCVLLLPCRHLCLCTNCGSTLLHSCPACNSSINTTVHVNMS